MACLVVTTGPAAGKHFALEEHQLVLVGRDDECTFQILDRRISRRHLQLKLEGDGGHSAIDFDSANGVLVNGNAIDGQAPLAHGDTIEIGGTQIVYSTSDYPDAQTAMSAWHKGGEWRNDTIT